MSAFNIIDYIAGLTGFVFDIAVLNRIAMDRGVSEYTEYSQLTDKDKDLLTADCLKTAYYSPNTIASHSIGHGSFTKSVGAQTIKDREELYNMFMAIYDKYGEEVAYTSNLKWI